jgi:hypothetical protein
LLACSQVKVPRSTFYKWLNTDREFEEKVEEAKLSRIMIVEDALYKRAIAGNTTAMIFFLVNRSNGKWRNVQYNTILGADGKAFVLRVQRILSDDEKKLIEGSNPKQLKGK